jgi:hypothetical protein
MISMLTGLQTIIAGWCDISRLRDKQQQSAEQEKRHKLQMFSMAYLLSRI